MQTYIACAVGGRYLLLAAGKQQAKELARDLLGRTVRVLRADWCDLEELEGGCFDLRAECAEMLGGNHG